MCSHVGLNSEGGLRAHLFATALAWVAQPAFAAPSCTKTDAKLTIQETNTLQADTTCKLSCLVLRKDAQTEVTCDVNVKAGDFPKCSAQGADDDKVIGVKVTCDGEGPEVTVERPQ